MSQLALLPVVTVAMPVPSPRETKRASWQQTQAEGLGARQRDVLAVIAAHGPISDRRIGELLRVPVNRVTGRRGELLEAGHIEQAGAEYDAATNRRVAVWRVAE